MKALALLLFSLLAVQPIFAASSAAGVEQPQLQCNIGPVTKIFGKSSWLTYSCSDGKSLVIVSAPGSPASPFYFFFYQKNGVYQLRGEGTGNQAATDAAYAQLNSLSAREIAAIIKETLKVSTKAKSK